MPERDQQTPSAVEGERDGGNDETDFGDSGRVFEPVVFYISSSRAKYVLSPLSNHLKHLGRV